MLKVWLLFAQCMPSTINLCLPVILYKKCIFFLPNINTKILVVSLCCRHKTKDLKDNKQYPNQNPNNEHCMNTCGEFSTVVSIIIFLAVVVWRKLLKHQDNLSLAIIPLITRMLDCVLRGN